MTLCKDCNGILESESNRLGPVL